MITCYHVFFYPENLTHTDRNDMWTVELSMLYGFMKLLILKDYIFIKLMVNLPVANLKL
jgi:hypothetical protein